ncbi:hypothetical protein PC117_g7235 [Phytophthora cactorum]|uniref:Uncharacterized protein n=1 Tax=Phytophthora cactorum TaxID=29920 RepID=A0A8T1E0Z7_9STRA|nr:hypothetical protein PC117_g7235 [Phytophthora cactorum]
MGKGRKKHSENGGRKPRGYKSSVPTHQFCFDVVLYFEDHSMDVTLSKFYKDLEGSQLQTKSPDEVAMATANTFKMIAPTRTDVVEWIAGDWDELTADTIANGFKGVVKESIDDGASKRQVGQIVGRIESMDLLDKRMGEVSE